MTKGRDLAYKKDDSSQAGKGHAYYREAKWQRNDPAKNSSRMSLEALRTEKSYPGHVFYLLLFFMLIDHY